MRDGWTITGVTDGVRDNQWIDYDWDYWFSSDSQSESDAKEWPNPHPTQRIGKATTRRCNKEVLNMAEAMGKSMFVVMVFISGMAATILLEKLMVLPSTCQVTGEVMDGSNYRR